jgi:hypothetical protein
MWGLVAIEKTTPDGGGVRDRVKAVSDGRISAVVHQKKARLRAVAELHVAYEQEARNAHLLELRGDALLDLVGNANAFGAHGCFIICGGRHAGLFGDKAYESEQILLANAPHFAAVCGVAKKSPPEKINVRLDKKASALVKAAAKAGNRSNNNEASTALIAHYELNDKKQPGT